MTISICQIILTVYVCPTPMYIFPIWVKLILFTLWANNGNNWLIIHVLAKIFSAFLIVGYLIVSLQTDKLYVLQKNNFDLFLVHVIWTEHQMSKLVLNVKYFFHCYLLNAPSIYNLGHIQESIFGSSRSDFHFGWKIKNIRN